MGAFAFDFAVIVDDGRVVAAAEGSADLFVSRPGDFAGQVYGDGPCGDDRLATGLAFQLLLRQTKVAGDCGNNFAQLRLTDKSRGNVLVVAGGCAMFEDGTE